MNNLSPRDITGHTLPLFFDLQSHMHASATPKPRLGMLDFDTIPVLGFVEDAWSETLKAVDKELSGRYARWEWERYRFPHRTGSSSADGFTTKPPHAVFYVENHARFVDVIRRFMPFTHAALAVQ